MRLTEDTVAAYAETLVIQARNAGHVLDYSEASLATLEEQLRLSDPAFRTPALPDERRNLVVFYNGCYLGEVLARNLGGVWRFDETNWADSSLVFAHGDGGIQVFPFLKLWRRLSEGPEDNDLVSYYEGLKARLAETL